MRKSTAYSLQLTDKKRTENCLLSSVRSTEGFTLIEILVVITIIGVVFGVVASSVAALQRNSRDTQRTGDLRSIQSSLQQYYADQHFFPASSHTSASVRWDIKASPGTNLTNQRGNPANPAPSPLKTYLITPKDPSNNIDQPYCYRALSSASQASEASPVDCDNASSDFSLRCNSYILCAKMESDKTTSANCVARCGAGYNFELTP